MRPQALGVSTLPLGYLGLAIRQEEVGATLVLGRAGAVDQELHVHALLPLLVHPPDALPKNTALTPGPTPACQACPLGGRTNSPRSPPSSPSPLSAGGGASTRTLWLPPGLTLRSPLRPENQTCI